MVTMAQRIEALRTERGLSRLALAAALGLPRLSVEKFETGRQTPTQDQQEKLAAYFGVSVFYLRGESTDRTKMEDWMDGAFQDTPAPVPAACRAAAQAAPATGDGGGTMLEALFKSKKFQESLRSEILEVLRSPEGQVILERVVRRELNTRK